MRIIGIDPGITGALALIADGRLAEVTDMPIFDGEADPVQLRDLFLVWRPDVVYVEKPHAMPKNGSVANFSMGTNTGILKGILGTLSYPYVRVLPMTWKKKMGLIGHDKSAGRGLVQTLYPEMADSFKLVKHHGRADAALIARYGGYDQIAMGAMNDA